MLPAYAGLLRHLSVPQLVEVLADPVVARKYTRAALQTAGWPILRHFPRDWLLDCLGGLNLAEGRLRALRFLLDADAPPR